MNSKALLVLALFLASTLIIFAEVAPNKDVDDKFKKKDDNLETNGVEEGKYPGRGGYGDGWRGGYGGWRGGYGGWRGGYGGWCRFGCCGWGYYGGCYRCCYYPGEHLEAHTNAEPHT